MLYFKFGPQEYLNGYNIIRWEVNHVKSLVGGILIWFVVGQGVGVSPTARYDMKHRIVLEKEISGVVWRQGINV